MLCEEQCIYKCCDHFRARSIISSEERYQLTIAVAGLQSNEIGALDISPREINSSFLLLAILNSVSRIIDSILRNLDPIKQLRSKLRTRLLPATIDLRSSNLEGGGFRIISLD